MDRDKYYSQRKINSPLEGVVVVTLPAERLKVKTQNAEIVSGGNLAYGPTYLKYAYLMFCKVRVADIVRPLVVTLVALWRLINCIICYLAMFQFWGRVCLLCLTLQVFFLF